MILEIFFMVQSNSFHLEVFCYMRNILKILMHSTAKFKYIIQQSAIVKLFRTSISANLHLGMFWQCLDNLENEFRPFKTFFYEMYVF